MNARYDTMKQFDRHFQERISPNEQLTEDYIQSVDAFFTDPATVGDHLLAGPMQDRRAFWINNDYRVVYQMQMNKPLFIDIGTHAQVYER